MRYGRCKNCWWYKENFPAGYKIDIKLGKLVRHPSKGICYMQSKNVGYEGAEILHETTGDNYCPDFTNRIREVKYGGKLLEEWIKEQQLQWKTPEKKIDTLFGGLDDKQLWKLFDAPTTLFGD